MPTSSLRLLALFTLGVLAARGSKAGEPGGLPPVVFVSRTVPAGAGPPGPVTPGRGRLVLLESNGSLHALVDGESSSAAPGTPADVLDPDVSYDGNRVVFSGLLPGEGYRIFEVKADGTGLRQITRSDRRVDLSRHGPAASELESYDDLDPCYLPDGRICLVSTRYPEIAPDRRGRATNLYVVNADGSDLHRITTERFGGETPAVDPNTGRIVYSRWWRSAEAVEVTVSGVPQGVTPPPPPPPPPPPGGYYASPQTAPPPAPTPTAPGAVGTFTAASPEVMRGLPEREFTGMNSWVLSGINPDGTDLAMHSGFHLDRAATQAHRPSFFPDGRAVAVFLPRTPFMGEPGVNGLRIFERGAAQTLALGGPQAFSATFLSTDTSLFLYSSASALPDGSVLVSARPSADSSDYDLFVKRDARNAPTRLFGVRGRQELDPVPLMSRALPPVLPDRHQERLPEEPSRDVDEAYAKNGSFTFVVENIHFNGPVDMAIANAPPVGRSLSIEFYTSPQRQSLKAADPPILIHRAEIGSQGRVSVELPAGVPLFEVLRRPDGTLAVGRDGQVFHVGGFNFGLPGQTARCVGCHTGHSLLEVPADPSWTNLAPGASVSSSTLRGSSGPFAPQLLVDRRSDQAATSWAPASPEEKVARATLRFPVPLSGREVVFHFQQQSVAPPGRGTLMWSVTGVTWLRGAPQERIALFQERLSGVHTQSLDTSRAFDELRISIAAYVYDAGKILWVHTGPELPGLAEVEVIAKPAYGYPPSAVFVRGDADCTGSVRLEDSLAIIHSLYLEKGPLCCLEAADANSDGSLDLGDAIYLLFYTFRGGDPPAHPFPGCDLASTAGMGCDQEVCR